VSLVTDVQQGWVKRKHNLQQQLSWFVVPVVIQWLFLYIFVVVVYNFLFFRGGKREIQCTSRNVRLILLNTTGTIWLLSV